MSSSLTYKVWGDYTTMVWVNPPPGNGYHKVGILALFAPYLGAITVGVTDLNYGAHLVRVVRSLIDIPGPHKPSTSTR